MYGYYLELYWVFQIIIFQIIILLYWVFKTNALASVMLTLVNGLTCTGFLTTSSYLDYLNLQEQFLGCLGYPAFKGAKSDFATKLKVSVLVVPFKSCFVT